MLATKAVDSSISSLKEMLGDPNNELSSEQRSKLKKAINKLKALKRAKKLTYPQIFAAVSEVARIANEALVNEQSK